MSAQVDLFYLKPAADKIIVLEAVYLGVSGVQGSPPSIGSQMPP